MANCQKNTDYQIIDAASQQIRNIALSADGKNLEINLWPSGTNECIFNIDSAKSIGLQIRGDNFRLVEAYENLKNQLTDAPGEAKIKIGRDEGGRLSMIGMDDIVMGLEANIRYDAKTDKVIIEY